MGILNCARNGCDHIMCDRCILNGKYYLCDVCYEELLSFKEEWPEKMRANEVYAQIQLFLTTKRGAYRVLDKEEINKEFKRLIGD